MLVSRLCNYKDSFPKVINSAKKLRLKPWRQRIGINTGSAVAGVVGVKRLTYDVWGTAVNTAARLEQACEPDRINISSSTVHHVDGLFETEPRGQIEVKNLGAIDMHFLNRIKLEYSEDADGCVPNEIFGTRSKLARADKLANI